MSLKEYSRKRDFKKTAEPAGVRATGTEGRRFVVQKHAASHLHYDFRLEVGGTLKSWAVPKGIPLKKGEKKLAVQVEDHPVGYIDFEGTIPQGQYGGGTVMVWDRGTYEPIGLLPGKGLESGKLHFRLDGQKLKGEWHLIRLRGGKQWLLIRAKDDLPPVSERMEDTSALTGRSMREIAGGDDAHHPNGSHRMKKTVLPPVAHGRARHSVRAARGGGNKAAAAFAEAMEAPQKRRPTGHDKDGAAMASPRTKSSRAPAFVPPMMARLVERPPKGDWIYEIKLDGFRTEALKNGGQVQLISRNGKNLERKFPGIAEAVAKLRARDAIIDGEIVALDSKGRSAFQLLQAYDLGEKRPPLLFVTFDLLRLDGKDLRNQPLIGRKALLEKLLEGAPAHLSYSASLTGDPNALLAQAAKLGLEGLVGKQKDSVYEAGERSGAWIKLKVHQEQEMVIGGHTDPEGSREYFGALLVGYYEKEDLKFAGKVGTGFNANLLKNLHDKFKPLAQRECPFVNLPEKRGGRAAGLTAAGMKKCHWVEPKLVCQIKFSEWTRDGKLRQPVFLGLREDKKPAEVVRETPA